MKRALFRQLRMWLPPRLTAWLTRHRRNHYSGPYRSWAEACAHSTGYTAPHILERVASATRTVVAGEAAFERDSIAFPEPAPDPLVLATLLHLHQAHGAVRVLDFGGALGGSYHQHRKFLPDKINLAWQIVEQPHYVECGLAEFQTAELRFHQTIAEAVSAAPPHFVLMSSVLQYLATPWDVLDSLTLLPAQSWIVSRTPFHSERFDLPVVQHVPANIYRADYPAWILAEETFRRHATNRGLQLDWHAAPEGTVTQGPLNFSFRTAALQHPTGKKSSPPSVAQ